MGLEEESVNFAEKTMEEKGIETKGLGFVNLVVW